MTQYFQIVQNIDELKRLYPDLNMEGMQVVQVTGDDGTTQTRPQVVYQTGNQNTQQQQTTQYILQDESVHHQQQQQQQQQQIPQQHVYQQVQQDQRHQMQQHHQQQHQPQQQQQMYYTSEMHPNTTVVQHTSPPQQQQQHTQQQVQQQQHQHAQPHQTHTTGQSTQQILYRMPVTQQQAPQQTQQILNNTHVIVQQSQPQVLIQTTPQAIHQPEMVMRQQRILFNPSRTVMYTHQPVQAQTQIQQQQDQQQQQQHMLQTQESVHQQHTNTVTAQQQQQQQHVQMQQPRLVQHPRPIVSATQQPSQNVIFHQVPAGQSVTIQQPQGVISNQLRSTIRAKIPRGVAHPRGGIGQRAATPMGANTTLETVKSPKARGNATGAQRGNRGGRTVRGRGAAATNQRSVSLTATGQIQTVNTATNSTNTISKPINQQNIQQQQQQQQQTTQYKLQCGKFIDTSQKYTQNTTQTNQTPITTMSTGTSTYETQNTQSNTTTGNYQSNNLDLEDSIQAVVVKKNPEQPQNVNNTNQIATTLTTYYTENDSNDDSRFVKTQNGTCMTLSEYKKRNPSTLKIVQQGQRNSQASSAAGTPTSVGQKLQLSNAAGQTPTTSLTGVARIALQTKSGQNNVQTPEQQQQQQQQQQPMTLSSVQRTSHNNYEIQTQHVIQNRNIQQVQNYSEKDRNSAKMLVILASGEQRLITFTLPRESCTVQDLLEQVGVPFDDKTTIQCVESPGANIDFVVTVGFSVQESASELISKAEESIQMSRQQESAAASAAAAAAAAAAALQSPQQVLNTAQRSMQGVANQNTAASSAQAVAAATATGTDDACKDANKAGEEVQRKVIQGYLAVCQYCGFCGYDHAKCERCKRVFLEDPKRMPCQKSAAAVAAANAAAAAANAAAVANAAKADEIKKRVGDEVLNRAQSKALASLSVASGRGGRNLPSNRGGRTRSGRAKPADIEPVILTLSSDDDGDDEQSNKSAHKIPVVNAVAAVGKPFAFEPDVSAIDESRIYADFRRENVADSESALDSLYTSFTCKLIRIGTHRFETKDPVTFTKKGIRILAPNCSNLTDIVALDIYKEEIVKIVAFFSKSFSVMFIYTMRKCAEYIRESLEMKPKNTALETPYFNSAEKGDTYNKIILQIETISEESINVIRSIYKSITLEEIQFQDANELLLRAAAKDKYVVNANSNEIRLDPNDIRQILIYPPGKGGISINTEDYMCLATDQYLNDVIIDFYLKWLHNNVVPEKSRDRTYIFSSFFYKRLTTMSTRPRSQNAKDIKQTAAQKRHARVANWTKNVNLFDKDFIIIPINELSHWFLAIICFPMLKGPVTFDTNEPIVPQQVTKKKKGAEKKVSLQIGNTTITPLSKRDETVCLGEEDSERDEAEGDDSDLASDDSDFESSSANGSQRRAIKQPVILIFDSLMGASRSRVVATLRDYLTCEYQAKVQDNPAHAYTKLNMPGNCVKVPQQNNFTDCGLYVLQYVEQFFADPIRDYTIPIKQVINWFDTIVVTRKREEISNLLTELIHQHNPSQLPLPKIPFPTLNGELIDRPDESFSEDQVEFEEEDMEEDGLEDDDAETQSSPEEPPIVRNEKISIPSSGNTSIPTTTTTLPTPGRKIILKRSMSGLSVNARKTPKLDP